MIHVPAKLRPVPLARMSLSEGLRHALRRAGMTRLGDLQYFVPEDLDPTCGSRTAMLKELATLVPRAMGARISRSFVPQAFRHWPRHPRVPEPPFAVAMCVRDLPLAELPLSARLRQGLAALGFARLGDLEGVLPSTVRAQDHCGPAAMRELDELLRLTSARDFDPTEPGRSRCLAAQIARFAPPHAPASPFSVAASAWGLRLAELPLSVRLRHVLERMGAERLGELDGVLPSAVLARQFCGRRTLDELRAAIGRANAGDFDLTQPGRVRLFARLVEELMASMDSQDRRMVELRLGATGQPPKTLEAVAICTRRTRERVRQVVERRLERVVRLCAGSLAPWVRELAAGCEARVMPLTPAWWARWAAAENCKLAFPPAFYLRVLALGASGLPIWSETPSARKLFARRPLLIQRATFDALRSLPGQRSFPEVFQTVCAGGLVPNLRAVEFLAALQHLAEGEFTLEDPEQPRVLLLPESRSWRSERQEQLKVLRNILAASAHPLSVPELKRQAERVGAHLGRRRLWRIPGFQRALRKIPGFYLLGPRCFGLRQHFLFPEGMWPQARAAVRALLQQQGRPLPIRYLLDGNRFDWAGRTNSYELACNLREDPVFTMLRLGLVGLAEWGGKRVP